MTNRRRRILRVLAAAILFLLLAGMFGIVYLVRTQGAVDAVPQEYPDVLGIVEHQSYCQRDERWAELPLGESRYTMADSGCLVCCLASAMEMQGIADLMPGELCTLLNENEGFDKQGNLQWDVFSRVTGAIVAFPEPNEGAVLLDDLLSCETFPIVRVRKYGFGADHYVLLLSNGAGAYCVMDPLDEFVDMKSLKVYGNRIYAIRYLR